MALRRRRLLACALVVMLGSPALAETDDTALAKRETRSPESVRKELDAVRKDIKEQQLKEKDRDRKVARLLEEMRALDDRLLASARDREELKREEQALESQKAARVDELNVLEKQYALVRGRLQSRLSSIYKSGRLGSTRVLAHAANSTEPLRMARYLAAVSKADSSAIQEFENLRYRQEAALRDITEKKQKLAGKKAALQDAAGRYDIARKQKTMMLGALQEEVSAEKSTVGKLQATEEQLTQLLASIPPPPPAIPADEVGGAETAPTAPEPVVARPVPTPLERRFRAEHAAAPFNERKGDLEVPVRGRVVAKFGEQLQGSSAVQGLLLRAEQDQQVVAVARGEVVFAGPFPGLGNTVIINHGSRYHTVYAHLDSILREVGARVRENEIIGTLTAAQPTLHFELRAEGKAQDPLAWFKGGKEAFVP